MSEPLYEDFHNYSATYGSDFVLADDRLENFLLHDLWSNLLSLNALLTLIHVIPEQYTCATQMIPSDTWVLIWLHSCTLCRKFGYYSLVFQKAFVTLSQHVFFAAIWLRIATKNPLKDTTTGEAQHHNEVHFEVTCFANARKSF